jgi:hypothetical protein
VSVLVCQYYENLDPKNKGTPGVCEVVVVVRGQDA